MSKSSSKNLNLKEFIDFISLARNRGDKSIGNDLSRSLVINIISCFIENNYRIVNQIDNIHFKDDTLNKKFIAFTQPLSGFNSSSQISNLEILNLIEMIEKLDKVLVVSGISDNSDTVGVNREFLDDILSKQNTIQFNEILNHKWLQEREIVVRMIGDDAYEECLVKVSDLLSIENGNFTSIKCNQRILLSNQHLFLIEYLNSFHLYPILRSSQHQLPYQTAEYLYIINFNDTPLPSLDHLTKFTVGVKMSPPITDFNEFIRKTITNFSSHIKEFEEIKSLFTKKLALLNQSSNLLLKFYTRIREKIEHNLLNEFKLSTIIPNLKEFEFKFKNEPLVLNYLELLNKNQLQLVPPYNRTENLKLNGDISTYLTSNFTWGTVASGLENISKLTYDNHVYVFNTIGTIEQKFIEAYQIYNSNYEKLNGAIKALKSSILKKSVEVVLYIIHQDSYLFQKNDLTSQLEFNASQLEYLIQSELEHRKRFENSISFYQVPFGLKFPLQDNKEIINPLYNFLPKDLTGFNSFQTFNESISKDTNEIINSILKLDRDVSSSPYTNEKLEFFKDLYVNNDDAQIQQNLIDNLNLDDDLIVGEDELEEIEEEEEEEEQWKPSDIEKYSNINKELNEIYEELSKINFEELQQWYLDCNESGKEAVGILKSEIEYFKEIIESEPNNVQFNDIMSQLEDIKVQIQSELFGLEQEYQKADEFLNQYGELKKFLISSRQEEQDLFEEVEVSKKRVSDLVFAYEEKKKALSKQLLSYDKEIQNQKDKLKIIQDQTKKVQSNRAELDSILGGKIQEKDNEILKIQDLISNLNEAINLMKNGNK